MRCKEKHQDTEDNHAPNAGEFTISNQKVPNSPKQRIDPPGLCFDWKSNEMTKKDGS